MVETREYRQADLAAMADIWNAVVVEGIAFPQEETLTPESAAVSTSIW